MDYIPILVMRNLAKEGAFMNQQLMEKSNSKYGVYKSQSTGTENYYPINLFTGNKMLMTDGVRSMFNDLECNWLGDVIASYFGRIRGLNEDFMTCEIIKNITGNGCTFVITDGDYNALISQKIPYTDVSKNIKMYLQFDGERYVLMMPQEY